VDPTLRPIPCCFLVSLKAFGDFVIALHTLRNVRGLPPGSTQLRLLAGEHLRDLARILGVEQEVVFVPSGSGLPAAFDFKRRGLLRGLASLLELRRSLRGLPRDCQLVFDWREWRENFIGSPYRRWGLVRAPNVYLALAGRLRLLGFDLPELAGTASATAPSLTRGLARIFPSSRNDDKCFPVAVTARLVDQLSRAGMACEVIDLEGEGQQLPSGLPVRSLKRNFGSLTQAVSASDLVVTADSLPGHLAEYYGLPVYVLSPKDNSYWLPLSCFIGGAWSAFQDERSFPRWLSRRSNSQTD
jgi:hypothetical protein